MPRNPDEIGALWLKEKNGKKYLTGKIDGIGQIVVFKNDRKNSEKQPDYRILRSQPREQSQDQGF